MDLSQYIETKSLAILASALVGAYTYMTWPYNVFKKMRIPGPEPIPFFGNWWGVGTEKTLTELDNQCIEKYGKICGCFNGWTPEIIIAEPALIKDFTIKQSENFQDRRDILLRGVLKYSIFDLNGSDWKRGRALVTPFFSSGKLKQNTNTIASVADDLVIHLEEAYSNKKDIEGRRLASAFTMDVICGVGFGVNTQSLKVTDHPLAVHSTKLVRDFGPSNLWFLISFFFPGIASILNYFDVSMFNHEQSTYIKNICQQLIKQKQEGHKETNEFVTALITAHENQQMLEAGESQYKSKALNEKEIISNAMLFLLAGYDTTASTLAFLFYNLATYPECQETLYDEINLKLGEEDPTYDNIQKLNYLDWCIDETLRIYPPIPRFDRKCVKATRVGHLDIPEGMVLTVPIYYLHMDPEVWPDPHTFDPLRFSPEKSKRDPIYFMPFGIGPRQCVGMRLALLELKIATIKVIKAFQLVPTEKTVPVRFDPASVFTASIDGLWFGLEKRH